MVNEAVCVELCGQPKGVPISYTIPDATAVEKYTLMSVSGGAAIIKTADKALTENVVTGVKASADPQVFAGIASVEKVANDGSVKLGLYTKGIFDLTACPASGLSDIPIATGNLVVLSGANLIRAAKGGDMLSGAIVGKALEPIAASAVGQVAVGVYS